VDASTLKRRPEKKPDERFQKSVVFVCKHDEDGALGIIVNNKVEDLPVTAPALWAKPWWRSNFRCVSCSWWPPVSSCARSPR
jgi:hypothetical protein